MARGIAAGLPAAPASSGTGPRIGLLGGSFNPAHGGHLHVSRMARARLGLARVWWLVSPQNPLKPSGDNAPFETRLAAARDLARGGDIVVSDLEAMIGSRYSVHTVRFLLTRYAGVRFVWIMGADNLEIFHRWRGWREIAERLPIAVIDRPGAGPNAVAAPAARSLAAYRIPENAAGGLADLAPPAWTLIHGPLSPASSTRIRGGLRGA